MSSVNETNGNAVNLIEEKNKKIEELRKIYNEINMKNNERLFASCKTLIEKGSLGGGGLSR